MPETTNSPEAAEQQQGEQPNGSDTETAPIAPDKQIEALQAEVSKWKSHARTWEERSKEKEQKLSEQQAASDQAVAAATAQLNRFKIGAEHGLAADDIELFLTATDPETITAQAKALADRQVVQPPKQNYVSSEGGNPEPKRDPMTAFAEKLFKE